jgi:outer membrane protein
MKIFRLTLILVFAVCLSIRAAMADEEMVNVLKARIDQGEKLSLEECIELAIENNPSIQAAKNTTEVYKSRIGQAKSGYYPQVNLSTGYDRKNAQTSSPVDKSSNSYQGNISLNQLIYDFGKTSTAVKIQKLGLDASNADVNNTVNQTTYNVKKAYYNVLYALKNKEVCNDTIGQYEQQLKQAKAFFDEGLKPKIDVTNAEVNLSNAKFNYIKADNAVESAYSDLNAAMGFSEALTYSLSDKLEFKNNDFTLDTAVEEAYKNRPDLKSLVSKESAAKESVNLAKKDYLPKLEAITGYGLGGSEFPLDSGWSVGGQITLPVFDGLLTHNKVKEARTNLNAAKLNQDILKLSIFKDVQKAYIAINEAKKKIPVSEMAVKQAKENFDLATGRYEVGIGNPIEVKDAEVSYSNARLSYYQALYDYNTARSTLEWVVGRK